MAKPDYDTTLARIAGNIAAGLVASDFQIYAPAYHEANRTLLIKESVRIARGIVEQVRASQEPQETT